MKRRLSLLAIVVLFCPLLAAPPPAAAQGDIVAPLSPPLRFEPEAARFAADADEAAAIYVNPAGLAWRNWASSILQGTYCYDRVSELDLSFGGGGAALGYSYTDDGLFTSNTYLLGLAAKLSRFSSIGATLRWHHTSLPMEDRSPFAVDLGFAIRPSRFLSIAGVLKNANEPDFSAGEYVDPFRGPVDRLEKSFIGGVSLRPLHERLTLSGQTEVADGRKPSVSFGGRMDLGKGFEVFGTFKRDMAWPGADPYDEYTVGFAFAKSRERTRYQARLASDGDADYGRYGIAFESSGARRRSAPLQKPVYVEIPVEGSLLDEGGGFALRGGSKDLHGLLRELESARRDRDVRGVLLEIGPLAESFIGPVSGNLHEVREAVLGVREAGKPVVAYLAEGGSSEELYLASAADRIVVPRIATVGLIGVSLELSRTKRLFGKLGIDFDAYTAGDYKSSFHTIYTDTTTAAQAEEIRSLVDESYRLLVEGIAEGRGIGVDRMREIADGRVFTAEQLLAERLVDAVGWKKDAKAELGRLASVRKPDRLETTRLGRRSYWTERWQPAPAVAIVGAYGGIESGKSKRSIMGGGRTMGSETVVKQLAAAARHPGVRAIVLRVDSGGGSALASDEILEEIRRIQKERGIPVAVSMGNVAGSGGYWISMYGDRIFADPFTVTGSIGVVWFKPVLERLYERVGVTHEVFKAGEHSDAMSWSRAMTEDEKKMLGGYIDGMYGIFVDKVAEGRRIDPARVREIGGGRVYLGTQALELRLVDEIGGLADAVAWAAGAAGIADDYGTVYFKAFPGLFSSFDVDGSPIGAARALGRLIGGAGSPFDETLTIF